MVNTVRQLDADKADSDDKYQGRKVSRAGSVERREKILNAVLRIIARDGIRGVKHRAVAKEAEVPLASTTYYFKDINDLMSDAFNFFGESDAVYTDRLKERSFAEISQYADQLDDAEVMKKIADLISEFATEHVMSQICDEQLQNRMIEKNFQIEAARNERLKQPYIDRIEDLVAYVVEFYQAVESGDPNSDARIFKAIILDLEYEALLDPDNNRDEEKINRILKRHLYNSLRIKAR